MRKNTDTEILIIGAGMAGLSLAALLAQSGMRVQVIDREDPGQMARETFDSRTIALSAGTRAILSPLGIWPKLLPQGTAITKIDVQEGHDPFLLQFDAKEADADAFGWILPNSAVRDALYQSCLQHGVTFVTGHGLESLTTDDTQATVTLTNGTSHSAPLLIAADGRNSFIRASLGIDVVALDYHHTAVVGLLAHDHPHDGLALERFYPSGPFAALPFTDDAQGRHRSAIVWSRHIRDMKRAPVALNDPAALHTAIAPMLDERYGDVTPLGTWAAYPLSLRHAKSMIGPRVALISDAAHAIHPIAGQGLNLGMRDIAYLATALPEAKAARADIGSTEILEAYQRARRFDVFTMVAATDVLTRLFGVSLPPVRWARSLGLGIVEKLPPLKRFFMRQAMGG